MKTLPRKKLLLSRADNSAHVLRGLISYHKRMTSGNCPERDSHLDALRYALALVEKKRLSKAKYKEFKKDVKS